MVRDGTLRVRKLEREYPGIILNCRRWDCGYREAMRRMDAEKVTRWTGE